MFSTLPAFPVPKNKKLTTKVVKIPRPLSIGEETLAMQIRTVGLPAPDREFRFAPPRKWRFDFAWPTYKLAVEVEGGVGNGGRHTRLAGFEDDCEKYNAAALDGWAVLRFTTRQVIKGQALAVILNRPEGKNQ